MNKGCISKFHFFKSSGKVYWREAWDGSRDTSSCLALRDYACVEIGRVGG